MERIKTMELVDIPEIGGKLYIRDETDLWGLKQNGQYEPEETKLIKSLVKSNYTCLDIGANIGYFTILMAKQCKQVWAFEPEPTNFNLLIENIRLNGIGNIYATKAAVGWKGGNDKLYLCDKSHGMHRLYKSKHCIGEPIDVKTISIDSTFVSPDFVKIDVEGYELSVINGMYETLKECRPTIVMEFHPPSIEEAGHSPRTIYDMLRQLDYDIKLIPKIDEPISYEELYFETNDISGGQNILCRKK